MTRSLLCYMGKSLLATLPRKHIVLNQTSCTVQQIILSFTYWRDSLDITGNTFMICAVSCTLDGWEWKIFRTQQP